MANAARTAAACRIAKLDRQKFNDLMASGEYVCAPRTSPGVPRVFNLPDLIGLYLFTRLTERGRTVRQASEVTCRIVDILRAADQAGNELPGHVAIAYAVDGQVFARPVTDPSDVNAFATHFVAAPDEHVIMFSEVWNIANLRDVVEAGLAVEARVAGE